MTLPTLEGRVPQWVGKVPYSHKESRKWGYPTDCSGFVSWALNVTHDDKAFVWGSNSTSVPITKEDLKFGDIITHVYNCDMKHAKSYVSGHVFFFDKWVDADKTEMWAYESTETFDVTKGCKARTAPCYNHHVIKQWSHYAGWAKEECLSKTHGIVRGGPHRIHPSLLCPTKLPSQ
mmetsp:Transcript_47628/g.112084  ORF Transcript_47628/g.112084 Transcript_47628/m.112084 type:complete len:176 (-) Transcript_47628:22-549(-)